MTTDEKNTKPLTPWEQWEQSQRMNKQPGPMMRTAQRIVDFLYRGCIAVLALLLWLLGISAVLVINDPW